MVLQIIGFVALSGVGLWLAFSGIVLWLGTYAFAKEHSPPGIVMTLIGFAVLTLSWNLFPSFTVVLTP